MTDSRVPDLSAMSSPPRGTLTYEDLEIVERIGRGGQAVVSRANVAGGDPPNRIALKEPLSPETVTADTMEEFLAEAERWKIVDSRERQKPRWADFEHVVGVVDTGESLPWIALEYMDGGDLDTRLESTPGGLPLQEALWIGECVCRGVAVAHGYGIAHLDLKPANVLFRETPDGRWDVPKVADWGLARVLAERSGTIDGLSAMYAAPEQFEPTEFGEPDALTDIYQIGALVYAMLTGEPPYTGTRLSVLREVVGSDDPTPPSDRRDSVTASVDAAVLHALERDKTDRYRSVENFGDALRAIRTGERPARFVPGFDGDETGSSIPSSGDRSATAQTGRTATSTERQSDTTVTAIGCGSAGSNVVNRIQNICDDVETVALDTDEQHLRTIEADTKILVGGQGHGTGGDPSVGRRAAQTATERIAEVIGETDIVFVIAGLGGGTGTGAAPVVSRVAEEQDALVVAMVSTPWDVEEARMDRAERGLTELRPEADSLVVLDNNRLLDYVPNLPIGKAFSVMDQIIAETVRGVGETLVQSSLIELDYAAVAAVLRDGGDAAILVGETQDKDKTEVIDDAINHPLLDVDHREASKGIVHVTGGPDLTLGEARGLANDIVDRLGSNVSVSCGAGRLAEYKGKVRVCVILTGFEDTLV